MKYIKRQWGFTLVELIVVVTILAILATIWFVSYSSYLTWVRDTNRQSQLVSIHDWLALYSTKNSLPIPEDNVELKANVWGTDYLIAYQWYAGSNTLETIDFTKWWKDPRDDTYFTYMLTKDRKHFQLMAWLEESDQTSASLFPWAHAANYEDRIPTVYGNTLGVITDSTNLPIQEVSGVDTAGEIIFNGTGTEYTAHFSSRENVTSNGTDIMYWSYVEMAWKWNRSCKDILAKYPYIEWTDGTYWIKTNLESLKIPCDMTTEWWGWTLVAHGTDTDIDKYDSRWNGKWSSGNEYLSYIWEESTFKFTDSTINSIRDWGDYMLTWKNSANGWAITTYFTPSTCEYDHDKIVSWSCESMFNDIAFTNTSWVSTTDNTNSWKGIATWSSWIIMNFSAGNTLCFQANGTWGGCTNQSLDMSIKMYVR